jgi:hypothetical protein
MASGAESNTERKRASLSLCVFGLDTTGDILNAAAQRTLTVIVADRFGVGLDPKFASLGRAQPEFQFVADTLVECALDGLAQLLAVIGMIEVQRVFMSGW